MPRCGFRAPELKELSGAEGGFPGSGSSAAARCWDPVRPAGLGAHLSGRDSHRYRQHVEPTPAGFPDPTAAAANPELCSSSAAMSGEVSEQSPSNQEECHYRRLQCNQSGARDGDKWQSAGNIPQRQWRKVCPEGKRQRFYLDLTRVPVAGPRPVLVLTTRNKHILRYNFVCVCVCVERVCVYKDSSCVYKVSTR